ncbi:MAG: spermidine synthase [Spirochaetaceae bacterium]|nr:spermidine synthase [Spirochaetaceae bacterium]
MSLNYEELDFQKTPLGDLMLRRRKILQLGGLDVYEVKLGEHFLMTSLFHEAESQLSLLGLENTEQEELDVVVGGLGLGYTAAAALEDQRVKSLVVIEFLEPVIRWHNQHLVPMGKTLTEDPRCRFVQADFFALSRRVTENFDPESPLKKHHVILLDIDHTPTHVLHQTNSHFYSEEGLRELREHLHRGGVFALWADGSPQESFTNHLRKVFSQAESHHIRFDNPITGGSSEGTVYVARKES